MPHDLAVLDAAIDRLLIRETLERYCACLDARDFAGSASCFTEDCEAVFGATDTGGERLCGRAAVADWLRVVGSYRESVHAIGHLTVTLDGDAAEVSSLLVATLLGGAARTGRAYVRGIRYTDRLVRQGGAWLIRQRRHQPLWQYEALSEVPALPEPARQG